MLGEDASRYAVVAIDSFSKKIAVVPVERKEADLIIQALDSIIQQLGVPARLSPMRAASSPTAEC